MSIELHQSLAKNLAEVEATIEVLISLCNLSKSSENIALSAAIRQLEYSSALLRTSLISFEDVEQQSIELPTGLFVLLNELQVRFKERARQQKIEFYIWLETQIPKWVTADNHLLKLCFVNLLELAFQATDQGRVILRISHLQAKEGSELLIEVLDTGSGINSLNSNNIASDPIIHRIIQKKLGDKISIESIAGIGSKISVRIPITEYSQESFSNITVAQSSNSIQNTELLTKLSDVTGTIIGLIHSHAYRDLIQCITSYGSCNLHLRQTSFQFKEIVYSTQADLIVIEGFSNQEELINLIQEIRTRRIQSPILLLNPSQNKQHSDSLIKNGVEEIVLPQNATSFIELFSRYLPKIEKPTTSHITNSIVTTNKESVKTTLLEKMEPEQAENISNFITNLPNQLNQLEELLKLADTSTAAFRANELGGAAYMVGLPSIGEELLAIEKAAKQGDKCRIINHLLIAKNLISGETTETNETSLQNLPINNDCKDIVEVPQFQRPAQLKEGNLEFPKSKRDPIVSSVITDSPELLPLINDFLGGIDQYLSKIERAAEIKHWDALGKSAHETAGVAGMYGYPALSVLAKKLQHQAESKNPNDFGQIILEIKEIIEDMKNGWELMNP